MIDNRSTTVRPFNMSRENSFLKKMIHRASWPEEMRESARALLGQSAETRGRKKTIDRDKAIRDFIELEARARIVSEGKVAVFLRHPRLRLATDDNAGCRLNNADRYRLRKRHQNGKVEVEHLRSLSLHFGHPDPAGERRTGGEPDPHYTAVMHELSERIGQLQSTLHDQLFFLTGL